MLPPAHTLPFPAVLLFSVLLHHAQQSSMHGGGPFIRSTAQMIYGKIVTGPNTTVVSAFPVNSYGLVPASAGFPPQIYV
jgi:hypothetical protein